VTDRSAAPAPAAFAPTSGPVPRRFVAGRGDRPTFVHLLDALPSGIPVKAVVQNGIHADSRPRSSPSGSSSSTLRSAPVPHISAAASHRPSW
jgi:hypothetical protein